MAKIPLTGGFYEDSALQFDAQRCVNMYPVRSEVDGGKSDAKLKNVPGYKGFAVYQSLASSLDEGGILGTHVTSDGRYFVLFFDDTGTTFTYKVRMLEFFENGTVLEQDDTELTFKPEKAKMADNGLVIAITLTGSVFGFGFFYTLGADSLDVITDADYPDRAFDVSFKDTYFIWLDPVQERFYISSSNATNPADCVNALDFGTVESNPDTLQGIIGIGNEIAIFGTRTIEFFYNSGDIDFPFVRNSGATQEIGTIAKLSLSKINNEIYFIGNNDAGYGIIYLMRGYQPERISTHAIERLLRESTDLAGSVAYTYQDEGNYFYVLNVPDLDTTLVYDSSSGLWHERAFLSGGNFIQQPSENQAFAFGKNLVISYQDLEVGTGFGVIINELSNTQYENEQVSDAGTPTDIKRLRSLPHFTQENKQIRYNSLELDIQKGVGLASGDANDVTPVISLSMSRDGGETYGTPKDLQMGTQSSFKVRAITKRLGRGRDTVFKLESTSAVQQEWFTSYIDFEVLGE